MTQDRRPISALRPRGAAYTLVALLLCCLLPAAASGSRPDARARMEPCQPTAAHCSLAQRLAAIQLRRAQRTRAHAPAGEARPATGGSGSVEGTVTNVPANTGLTGIEVCAYQVEALEEGSYEQEEPDCAVVEEPSGAYRIAGLTPGAYVVEFFDPQRRYITQYWDDSLSPEGAAKLEVKPEAAAAGIDAAMVEGGRIEGVVEGGGNPLSGVFVCFAEHELELLGCTATGSDGSYAITALPAGEYQLGFIVPHTPGLNYLSELLGQEVEVQVSQTSFAGTVDLAAGGQIEGRVTAASSGAGLAGIEVTAYGSQAVESTYTARGGEYTLERLPSDEYEVEFFDVSETYLPQFFAGKSKAFEATLVNVVAGQATPGVDAALHTVAPEPPLPMPMQPPAPPSPPATPPAGTAVLPSKVIAPLLKAGGRVHVAGRTATVRIVCTAGPCKGTLQLLGTVVHRHRARGRVVVRRATVLLGSGSFSLAQGASGNTQLRLSAAGRRLLAAAARHPHAAKLKLTLSGTGASVHAVIVD